jgi:hypothetical protein
MLYTGWSERTANTYYTQYSDSDATYIHYDTVEGKIEQLMNVLSLNFL